MKIFKLLIPVLTLALHGCATQLPSFAHVHVGHSLSAWPDTPNEKGLFVLSEDLAVRIVETAIAASELSKQGQNGAAVQAGSKISAMIGTLNDEVSSPDQYTFLTAFERSINHLRYSAASEDATQNMAKGLAEVIERSGEIVTRSNVIKELASLLGTLEDDATIAEAVQQLRVMTIQNLEGGDGKYSLRDMRNSIAEVLAREDPPYVTPEKKYLFGVVRLPSGLWLWDFKKADKKGDYGRYSY
ncbi:MAG: hypothetical protein KJP04_01005 [Arenicella sp.]|nr:hypothetical protein [Arenicella sp.]